MSLFRSDDGEEIYEKSRKKTIEKNGKVYKRVPRPKYQSRSARCGDIVSNLESAKDSLQEIVDELNEDDIAPETITEKIQEAKEILSGIDSGELESLQSEMESWRDNMRGTNLESTSKFETVSECADYLSSASDGLSSITSDLSEEKDAAISEIEEQIQNLDEAIGNLESCEFPGMFG